MSQQEDMVAQDAGHDESGSYVAVSHAAEVADDAGDTADEALDDLDAEEEPDSDEAGTSAGSIERSLRAAQPLLQRFETILDNSGVLTMPPMGPVR